MINVKRVNQHDYIVSNSSKVSKYGWEGNNTTKCHTHVCGYNSNHKVALQIKYNVLNNIIPTYDKFMHTSVGKRNYIRYVESHIRVSEDKQYIENLESIIKNKKGKQEYFNKKCKVR